MRLPVLVRGVPALHIIGENVRWQCVARLVGRGFACGNEAKHVPLAALA